ncbi:MAG: N-formylglutamate amidohydrolase [Gammaproteobacteria bacterium]|nr:N-formylglutamate amidohydrolase [Gammaproteobacteria bacterium]
MDIWTVRGEADDGPVLATAIHNGHELRPEVRELHLLDDATRLREEDPFTDTWAALGDISVIVHRSRFEMDLNRDLEHAIYLEPADAWGLDLWKRSPPQEVVRTSRDQYRAYYEMVRGLLEAMSSRWERIVILDFHSYNHRRNGKHASAEPQAQNPDINVGTHDMDRPRWGYLVDAFIEELSDCVMNGRRLDVRPNVKFLGRQFPRWVDGQFPRACAIAIEVKKIFMDEWTGKPDRSAIGELTEAFRKTISRLKAELTI